MTALRERWRDRGDQGRERRRDRRDGRDESVFDRGLDGDGALVGAVTLLAVGLLAGFGLWLLLLGLAVPILWAISRRPQRGILLLAALAPFHGLLKISGLPSFAAGWKEVLVGAVVLLTFVCPASARGGSGRQLPGWVPALGGLLILGVLSAILISDPEQAAIGLRISYYSVFVAIAVWRCPLNRRERDLLVTTFMLVGFVTAVYGIAQQVIGHATLASWGYKYNEEIRFASGFRLRSFSTFIQPFPFAFYLMIVLLIGVPVALGEPRRLRSVVFFFALPVYGLGLMFSYVRGAWLGLGLGLLYLAFHRYKVLVLGIPIALTAALFLPTGTLQQAAFQSKSVNARTTGWEGKVSVIAQHPFGTGLATTGAAAEKVAKDTSNATASTSNQGQIGSSTDVFQPDNSYLKVGFELGILGLWLFVMLLVSAFLSLRAAERRVLGRDADLIAGISAQVLGVMAASFFATYFEIYPGEMLFWLLLGVGCVLPWQPATDREIEALPTGTR